LKAGLAAGAGLLLRGAEAAEGEAKVRVVAATNSKVFGEGNALKPAAVQELVDAAVARLMDEKEPSAAWKRLVKPSDVVGIKVNCLAGAKLSTRIEVVQAIAKSLQAAGVEADRIYVWDRKRDDLVRAGYPVDDVSSVRYVGNDHRNLGFAPPIVSLGEIGGFFSRLVTDVCSVIINVPVFKDHDLAGVSVALKSAFGAIHNPNKYHFGNLHQAIADINRVEALRRKTAVHLCDATFGCYEGGPTPAPKWVERMGTVYASRDPVALDHVVWQKIEELRKANGRPTLVGSAREPKHIALAAQHRIGTNDPGRIDVVKFEV
jgi:uncharacterized protein (DUF362 family)